MLPRTSNALDDYADLLVWQRRTYVAADQMPEEPTKVSPVPDRIRLDRKVTAIGCSLSDPAATGGRRIAPGPWPDGTATALASGTAVYAVGGIDSACVLASERETEVVAYVAVDIDGDWSPLC